MNSGLYISPKRQIELLSKINVRQGWGHTDKDFPKWSSDDLLVVDKILVLAMYNQRGRKSCVMQTFDDLIVANRKLIKEQGYELYDYAIDSQYIQTIVPEEEYLPCIRWEMLDLSTVSKFGNNQPTVASLWAEPNANKLAASQILTLIMLLLEEEVSIVTIMEMLGHVNLAGYRSYWDISNRQVLRVSLDEPSKRLFVRWDYEDNTGGGDWVSLTSERLLSEPLAMANRILHIV